MASSPSWSRRRHFYSMPPKSPNQDPAADVEYFAFHADHIHEPSGGPQPVHISVANRLTVSRCLGTETKRNEFGSGNNML